MSLRFLTAGESHGQAITAIVDGVPAGLPLSPADIDAQLKRRQLGYGRGRRMQIEPDRIRILSGVRSGLALGSPIALQIENKDWAKWSNAMAVEPVSDADPESDWRLRPVTRPRPGHADLAGALKHGFDDVRNVLERASARETAMRVAAGAVARVLLGRFGVCIASHVVRLGPVAAEASESLKPEDFAGVDESPLRCLDPKASEAMVRAVDEAKAAGQTLGGVFEVIVWGVPPGLGSHTQWDRKLDGRIAGALMSVQATKGVEVGLGFEAAARWGADAHDPILYSEERGIHRPSNRAGGFEGGMTNGEPLVIRAAMKPLSTLYKPLPSVDLATRQPSEGAIERSDITAVPAAAVVGEAVVAFEVARAFLEKFGGDSLKEMERNFEGYAQELAARGMTGWRRPASAPAPAGS